MSKRAKLITFSITTRVILDNHDDDVQLIRTARKQIMEAPGDYITVDTVTEVVDDLECPVGTMPEDNYITKEQYALFDKWVNINHGSRKDCTVTALCHAWVAKLASILDVIDALDEEEDPADWRESWELFLSENQ